MTHLKSRVIPKLGELFLKWQSHNWLNLIDVELFWDFFQLQSPQKINMQSVTIVQICEMLFHETPEWFTELEKWIVDNGEKICILLSLSEQISLQQCFLKG